MEVFPHKQRGCGTPPRDVDFDFAVKKAWLAFGPNQGMFVFGGIYIFSEIVGRLQSLG